MADLTHDLDRRSLVRLFPGFRLVAALRLSFDPRKLMIAALGVALLQLGWSMIDRPFPASAAVTPDISESTAPGRLETGSVWLWDAPAALYSRLAEPIRVLTTPVFNLLALESTWGAMGHALLSVIWLFIVWSICGCAIARIAIVQVAALKQVGVREALWFSLNSWSHLIVPPLCCLVGLFFCSSVIAAFGLLYRLPVAGPALAGAGLVIPLAMGLLLGMLLAGLIAGWTLMHAAIAAGADDALDAMSRVYGYLNQRIGPFLVLLAFVALEGLIGLQLADLLAAAVLRLTHWGLGLTAPAGSVAALFGGTGPPAGAVAVATHTFWLGLVRLLAHGWIYSFCWTASALIYLWLRHDVDETPWTEIESPAGPSTAAPRSFARPDQEQRDSIPPPAPDPLSTQPASGPG